MSGDAMVRRRRWAVFLCLFGIGGILLGFPFGRPLAGVLSLAVLGALFAGIALAVFRDRLTLRYMPWLAAFAGLSALSAWASDFRGPSIERVANGLVLMAAFPAGQVLGRSLAGRKGLSWVCFASVGLAALDLGWQRWTGRSLLLGVPSGTDPRVSGSLPNPNDVSFVSIVAPIAAGGLVSTALPWGFAAVAVALSGSRNAIMGLVAGAASSAAARRPVTLVRFAAAGIAMAFVALAMDLGGIRQRIIDTLAFAEAARFEAYRIGWAQFVEHPWLGTGPGVFFEVFGRAQAIDPEFHPELRGIGMPWIHNVPLEILAERGLPASVCLLMLVALASRSLVRSILATSRSTPERAWAAGVAGSLAAILAMSIFDLTFLKDWFSMSFWLVTGLACSAGTADPAEGRTGRGNPKMPPAFPPPANPP